MSPHASVSCWLNGGEKAEAKKQLMWRQKEIQEMQEQRQLLALSNPFSVLEGQEETGDVFDDLDEAEEELLQLERSKQLDEVLKSI